jgi:hypothetical protein
MIVMMYPVNAVSPWKNFSVRVLLHVCQRHAEKSSYVHAFIASNEVVEATNHHGICSTWCCSMSIQKTCSFGFLLESLAVKESAPH